MGWLRAFTESPTSHLKRKPDGNGTPLGTKRTVRQILLYSNEHPTQLNKTQMRLRHYIQALASIATILLLTLTVSSCGDDTDYSVPSDSPQLEYREPCVDDEGSNTSCRPRDVSVIDPIQSGEQGAGYEVDPTIPTVEEVLEQGLRNAGLSPVHLAIRGSLQAGSIRCHRKGHCSHPDSEARIHPILARDRRREYLAFSGGSRATIHAIYPSDGTQCTRGYEGQFLDPWRGVVSRMTIGSLPAMRVTPSAST